MASYFSKFPKITYQLSNDPNVNPLVVTNIFFRLKIIDALQNNSLIYYPYYVKDGETPEIIAFKYYKDIEKHWLILLVNNILDPQWDWPLSYNSFQNYVANKYGSVGNAQKTIHHYELITNKQESSTGTISNSSVIIDQNAYNSTPGFTFQEINLNDGTTVAITTTTKIIYNYDYEYNRNETKKQIKLLDKHYLSQIQSEFNTLTAKARG